MIATIVTISLIVGVITSTLAALDLVGHDEAGRVMEISICVCILALLALIYNGA